MVVNRLTPSSAIPEIAWPAYPGGHAAVVLSLEYQLQQSEYWSLEQLLESQFKQLGLLLTHSRDEIAFYRERLQAISWKPGQSLSLSHWQQIPILTRKEVQAAGPALRTPKLGTGHGKISEVHTSGSTGIPIRISKTSVCDLLFVAIALRDHLWHKRDLLSKLAMIRTVPDGVAQYPEGIRQSSWGSTVDGLYPSGECVVLAITATIAEQLEWLQREQPNYLLAFPSVVEALARHALRHKIRLGGLRQITTLGESISDDLRLLCKQAFDADLVDTYSAQEIGYMALQCPLHNHYHVQSEAVYLEVLNAQGEPCVPGEIGRVIATPLHNFAMPLIRYETGDFAEVGGQCSCGRASPVLKRILGRSRNILQLPDGNQLWPRLSELRYSDIVPVSQFQMVQKSASLLEVKLVPLREVSKAEEQLLRDLIVSRIGYPFQIEFSYHAAIPRSASGKYEDFKSEIPEQEAWVV